MPQHSRAFRSILVGILLYNYYLCIVTDPGVAPHNWVRNALFATTGIVHLCEFIQEPEFDDTDGYEVKKQSGCSKVLSHVQEVQATARTSLQDVQKVCVRDLRSCYLNNGSRLL